MKIVLAMHAMLAQGEDVKHKKPARRTVTIDLPQPAWDKLTKITDTHFMPKAVYVRAVLLTHLLEIK
jgi:hypothetical protein